MIKPGQRFWQRFRSIALPYWFSEEKWIARGLLALLVVLQLGQVGFNVLFNEQSGEFTSALAAQDAPRFWRSIYQCLVILVIAVPIYALYYYVRDKLGVVWRRWLTTTILEKYFRNRAYYRLNSNAKIDNPDQRICEDVNTFTQKSLYFVLIVMGALIQLVAFSGVLWSISKPLVLFLVIYALVGTLVTTLVFGRPLIGLNFLQLKREADFRFSLVRIRENAEAIALYRGEDSESSRVRQLLDAAYINYCKLIKWQFALNLFQYGYSFLTIVIPSAVIATRVISGELEVGRAVQAAGAFAAILGALAVIVDNFESLSRFAAGVDRLDSFVNYLSADSSGEQAGIAIELVPDAQLALKKLTLRTPDEHRALVTDLSIAINPGEGLMIVGPSGGGKSSLLRAIAGLWSCGTGKIVRPTPQEMLFLPQHPYMILGTLRRQILYPHLDDSISDDELMRLLESVNLRYVAERCGSLDSEMDWAKVLSVGEQQRLAVARVLLTKPRFAMLDEATSALDVANEERLYLRLRETETTLVSVSHRATILKYHHQVLELLGDGGWKLHPANSFSFRG